MSILVLVAVMIGLFLGMYVGVCVFSKQSEPDIAPQIQARMREREAQSSDSVDTKKKTRKKRRNHKREKTEHKSFFVFHKKKDKVSQSKLTSDKETEHSPLKEKITQKPEIPRLETATEDTNINFQENLKEYRDKEDSSYHILKRKINGNHKN